jgi:hypothetical protein
MKVALMSNPNYIDKLASGINRYGDSAQVFIHENDMVGFNPDVVCCWGLRRMSRLRQHHGFKRVLILERGYLGDRFTWSSLGWNGLNGYAEHPPCLDAGERFTKHFGHLLKPWKTNNDGYVLLMGQVPSDAALLHVNFVDMMTAVAVQLRELGHDVRFRPHPSASGIQIQGASWLGGNLDEALAGAKAVVTVNSNSSVDAVLAGIPCVTLDRGTMSWDVTSHDLTNLVVTPDRTQWANQLAWCQWSPEELSSGAAWEVLRASMPDGEEIRQPLEPVEDVSMYRRLPHSMREIVPPIEVVDDSAVNKHPDTISIKIPWK